MRSTKLLKKEYWDDLCQYVFGVPFGINRIYERYSKDKFSGSNTIFTNGIDDPWLWVTDLDPQGHELNHTMADCADCGHCGDFGTPSSSDPEELKDQRNIVM